MKKKRNNPVVEAKPLSPIPLKLQVSLPVISNAMLKTIRDDASHEHFNTAKMIAELNKLSDEINATLAYLKARRGDR